MLNKKLILGTVQFGMNYGINNKSGKPSLQRTFEILHSAFDHGIQVLDTAEAYGDSQEVIGAFHKAFPNKKFKVITKLHADSTSKTTALVTVNNDLSVLGVDCLHGYMFHSYDSLKKNPGFHSELLDLRRQGLIGNLGVSLYGNAEIQEVIDNYEFDFIQIPFNLLDNHNHRGKYLTRAKKKGIEIHTRSAFLQGLFFMDLEELPKRLTPLLPQLRKIDDISMKNKISVVDLSLNYPCSTPYIDKVVIGVDSKEQLISNLGSLQNEIPNKLWKEIERIKTKHVHLLNPSNW